MKPFIPIFIVMVALISGCINQFEKRFDCSLKEFPAESSHHYKVLFLGTTIIAENNVPRMVWKLAKSMGDSLFYLTMAPYDFDFERLSKSVETKEMINDFKWDYIVLQESGWRNALPPSMADSMSFRWADSLKQYISNHNPETKLLLLLTQGFDFGVRSVDSDWAFNDPEVANYKGMQNRINQNCFSLATKLNADIAPCGVLWNICADNDSTLNFYRGDYMNPNNIGSYLFACTLYCSIFKKKLDSAYAPPEINEDDARSLQYAVSEALFECNPDWRYY